MRRDSKPPAVQNLDRLNLRVSPETVDAIDAYRAARPGNISRNTWITEAIEEKLQRETATVVIQAEARRRYA